MSRSTVPFFLLAFGITWTLQLPGVLVVLGVLPGPVERFMAPLGLGAFGPALAAILAARIEGKGGIGALFAPIRTWRVGPVWYGVALLLPTLLFTAAIALFALGSGRDVGPWWYPPAETPRILAMFVFPIGEEIGWRGFALPRLQERWGALRASVILGLLWAAWHLPMFVVAGLTPAYLLLMVPFFLAGSLFFTWIYDRTKGSLLLAILAHVGVHLDNPNQALPALTPITVCTAAWVVFALAVLAVDRRVWAARRPLEP